MRRKGVRDQTVTIFSSPSEGDVVNIRAWAEGDAGDEIGDSEQVTSSFSYIEGFLSPPEISPQSGTFSGSATITISTDIDGAVIYYTTDGTPPDVDGASVYSGDLTIYQTTAINAIVAYAGSTSSVASAYVEVTD